MFRNFKGVEKTAYGRGSFNKLGEILAPHRSSGAGYLIFFVDEYFEGNEEFKARIPLEEGDNLEYISVAEEPTTVLIDTLR
ncbi:MAG: alcohol dehydrogenase, partial [Cyclobacteriaceae bacterium]|nr:alcohol dehydrogenase [Cyclobacteriaceae bacterium]